MPSQKMTIGFQSKKEREVGREKSLVLGKENDRRKIGEEQRKKREMSRAREREKEEEEDRTTN